MAHHSTRTLLVALVIGLGAFITRPVSAQAPEEPDTQQQEPEEPEPGEPETDDPETDEPAPTEPDAEPEQPQQPETEEEAEEQYPNDNVPTEEQPLRGAIGGEIGFDTNLDEPFIGARVRLELSLGDGHWLSIVPGFDYYLMGEGASGWRIDGNVLYNFQIPDSILRPYAGGGISFTRLTVDAPDSQLIEDQDTSDHEFGINLVAGTLFTVHPLISPYAQLRITLSDEVAFAPIGGVYVTF